jgi:hypothetical protein
VHDVRIGDLALRHYAFTDRWFAVNCTLDLAGRFVTEPGPIDWCFNCDICTPLFSVGNNLYSVDLALDVLASPDGRTHVVVDEDNFALAAANGWLTAEEQAGARRGLEELLGIVEHTGLVTYLDQVFPFGPIAENAVAPPMARRALADVPLLRRDRRAAYLGQRLDEV